MKTQVFGTSLGAVVALLVLAMTSLVATGCGESVGDETKMSQQTFFNGKITMQMPEGGKLKKQNQREYVPNLKREVVMPMEIKEYSNGAFVVSQTFFPEAKGMFDNLSKTEQNQIFDDMVRESVRRGKGKKVSQEYVTLKSGRRAVTYRATKREKGKDFRLAAIATVAGSRVYIGLLAYEAGTFSKETVDTVISSFDIKP